MGVWLSDVSYYRTDDERVVGFGDPEARFLIVAKGCECDDSVRLQYGLPQAVKAYEKPPDTFRTFVNADERIETILVPADAPVEPDPTVLAVGGDPSAKIIRIGGENPGIFLPPEPVVATEPDVPQPESTTPPAPPSLPRKDEANG